MHFSHNSTFSPPFSRVQILAHDTDLHGTHTGGLTNGTSLEQAIMFLLIKDQGNNLPKVGNTLYQ